MGREAVCEATIDGRADHGRVLLETDEIVFRGAVRVKIPVASIERIDEHDGLLRIVHASGNASFALGKDAARWVERVQNPPSRADKLGIREGVKTSLVNLVDPSLERELAERGAVTTSRGVVDVLFLGVEKEADLRRIAAAVPRLGDAGALWIIRPRGVAAVSEALVREAALTAGLVDVKVTRYSDTHTAEKMVVPRARRGDVVTAGKAASSTARGRVKKRKS